MEPVIKLTDEHLVQCHGRSEGAILVRLQQLSLLDRHLASKNPDDFDWDQFETYCSHVGASWFSKYIYDPVKKVVQTGKALFNKVSSMIGFLVQQAQEFSLNVWGRISDWLSRAYYHVGLSIPDPGQFSSGVLGLITGVLTFVKNLSGCETTGDLLSLLTTESVLFKKFGQLWDTLVGMLKLHRHSSGPNSDITHAGELLVYRSKTFSEYTDESAVKREILKFDTDYASLSEEYKSLGSLSSDVAGDLQARVISRTPQNNEPINSNRFSEFDEETSMYTTRLRSVLGMLLEGETNQELMVKIHFGVLKTYLSRLMSFVTKIATWTLNTVGSAFSRTFEMIRDVFASLLSPGNAAAGEVTELIMPMAVYMGNISAKVSHAFNSSAKIPAEYAAKAMTSVVGKLLSFCAKIAQAEELIDFLEWDFFLEISTKIRIQLKRSKGAEQPPPDSFHFFMWISSIIREKQSTMSPLEVWKESVLDTITEWLKSEATWRSQGSDRFEDFRDLVHWLEFSKVKAQYVRFLKAIDEGLLQAVQSAYGWVACGLGWIADASGNLVHGSKVVKSYTLDSIDDCLGISEKISGFVEGTKKKSGVVLNQVARVANMPASWWKSRSQFWKIIWKCVLWLWKIVKIPLVLNASAQLLEYLTGIHVPPEILNVLSYFSVPFAYEFVGALVKLYNKLSVNMTEYFEHFQRVLSASFVKQTLGNTQPDMAENLLPAPGSESSAWVTNFDSLKETTFQTIRRYPNSSRRLLTAFKQYEEAVKQLSDKLDDWKGTNSLMPSYKFSKQLSLAVIEAKRSESFRKYFKVSNFSKLSDGFLDHLETQNVTELFARVTQTKKQLISELELASAHQPQQSPQLIQGLGSIGNIIKDALKGFTEVYSLERVVKKLSGAAEVEQDLATIVAEYSAISEALVSIRDRLIVSITGGSFVTRGLDLLGLEPISDALTRESSLRQATRNLETVLRARKKTRSAYIKEIFGGGTIFVPDTEFQRFLNELSKIGSRLELVLSAITVNEENFVKSRAKMKLHMGSMFKAQKSLKKIRDDEASRITVRIVNIEDTSGELGTLKKHLENILENAGSVVEAQLSRMEEIGGSIDKTVQDISDINAQLRVAYIKKEFSSIGLVDIMYYMAGTASFFSTLYYIGNTVTRGCANAVALTEVVKKEGMGDLSGYLSSGYLRLMPLSPFFETTRNRADYVSGWHSLFVNSDFVAEWKKTLKASYPINEAPWSIKKICCALGSNIPVSLSVESSELISVIPSCFSSEQLQMACKNISVHNPAKRVYLDLFKKCSTKESLFNQSVDTFLLSEVNKVADLNSGGRHSLVKLEFGPHNDLDSVLQRSSALSNGYANSLIVSVNKKHLELLGRVTQRCSQFFASLKRVIPQHSVEMILEHLQDWKRPHANDSELMDNFFQMLVSFVFLGGEEYRSQNRLGKLLSQILTREVRDTYGIMSLPGSNDFHWKILVNSVEKPQYSPDTPSLTESTLFEKLGVALLCGFDMLLKQLALEIYVLSVRSSGTPLEDFAVFYPTKDTLQRFGTDANPQESQEFFKIFFEELFGFGVYVADHLGISSIPSTSLDIIVTGGLRVDSISEWLTTNTSWWAYNVPIVSWFVELFASWAPDPESASILSKIVYISKICLSSGLLIWLTRWCLSTVALFDDSWITDSDVSRALRIITNRVKATQTTKDRWRLTSFFYGAASAVDTMSKITPKVINSFYRLTIKLPFLGTITNIVISMVRLMIGVSLPIYMVTRLAKRVDMNKLFDEFSKAISSGIDGGLKGLPEYINKAMVRMPYFGSWFEGDGTSEPKSSYTNGGTFGSNNKSDPTTDNQASSQNLNEPGYTTDNQAPPQNLNKSDSTTDNQASSQNPNEPDSTTGRQNPPQSGSVLHSTGVHLTQTSAGNVTHSDNFSQDVRREKSPSSSVNVSPNQDANGSPPLNTNYKYGPFNDVSAAYDYKPDVVKGDAQNIDIIDYAKSFSEFSNLMFDLKPSDANLPRELMEKCGEYQKENQQSIFDYGLSETEIKELYEVNETSIQQRIDDSHEAMKYIFLMHPFTKLREITGGNLLEPLENMRLNNTKGFNSLKLELNKLVNESIKKFTTRTNYGKGYLYQVSSGFGFQTSSDIVRTINEALLKLPNDNTGADTRKRTRPKVTPLGRQTELLSVDISWSIISSDGNVPIRYEVYRNCLDIKNTLFSLLIDDEPYSKVAVFTVFSVPVFCYPDGIDHLSFSNPVNTLPGLDVMPDDGELLPDIHLRTCLRLLTTDPDNTDETALKIARETLELTARYLYDDVKLYLELDFVEDIGMLFKIAWYMIFRDSVKMASYYRAYRLASKKPLSVALDLDPETLLQRKQDIKRLLSVHAPEIVKGLEESGIPSELSQKLGLGNQTFSFS